MTRIPRCARISTVGGDGRAASVRAPARLYLIPTTIESGPARGSTSVSLKPTPRIHASKSAPERLLRRLGGVGLGEPCALFPSSKEPCRSEDFADALFSSLRAGVRSARRARAAAFTAAGIRRR